MQESKKRPKYGHEKTSQTRRRLNVVRTLTPSPNTGSLKSPEATVTAPGRNPTRRNHTSSGRTSLHQRFSSGVARYQRVLSPAFKNSFHLGTLLANGASLRFPFEFLDTHVMIQSPTDHGKTMPVRGKDHPRGERKIGSHSEPDRTGDSCRLLTMIRIMAGIKPRLRHKRQRDSRHEVSP